MDGGAEASQPGAPATRAPATWTLGLDESGRFEGALVRHEREGEPVAWVVGGVLLPGSAETSARVLAPFRAWCQRELGHWPAHATDEKQRKPELVDAAAAALAGAGGLWLFVVAEPGAAEDATTALLRFVRMFGATVDLAGRVVAALGGEVLDARPAQRSVPLRKEALPSARSRGAGEPLAGEPEDEPWLR